MAPQKLPLTGIVFAACLYVLTIVCYVVFRNRFFAFSFGLAAVIATVSLLTRQRLN
jgi:hypothetical protein